ncbi:MAG: hypothetical protein LC662_14595 [Rhodothermaceae bacterium]|nr:hypothetical protein [Rhodothermaceae bacterium]
MLRIIFILLFVYLCVIIVRRMLFPGTGAKTNTRFYYQKHTSRPGGPGGPTADNRSQARKNLEQIEDADFEVIEEKDKKEQERH